MNITIVLIYIFFQSTLAVSQSISINQFEYQLSKILNDSGKEWDTLTMFSPFRTKSNSLSYINWQTDFDSKNGSISLGGYGFFRYNNLYFFYSSPKTLSKSLPNYQVEKMNNPYNNINHSGFGYKNNWVKLQIGRGNESWGSGNDIQLALNENSSTYDYFLLASDYGRVRVRYIYGFLENMGNNINRYITARGFEWTNKKSLIVGFSETVIYSGENRSFDIGYLNPISSHLEVELNDRLNITGARNSNAVWQIHIDYFLKNKLRISLNYLIDEFVIDPDIEIGKEQGKAFSIKLVYTPDFIKNHFLNFYSSAINVGTPTFRHGIGTNNFVQNGKPLGWPKGSDGQEFCIGINYYNGKNLTLNIFTGLIQIGEENISNRSYETYSEYQKGPFPSGKIEKDDYKAVNLIYLFKQNYSISSSFHWSQDIRAIDLILNVPIFQSFGEKL